MVPPEVRPIDYASRLPPGRRSFYSTTKVRLRRLLRNRKFRRRATGVAVAIVVLVVAGYVSDWVSAAGCERDTAVWLGRDFILGRPFQIWRAEAPESAAIFAAAGMTPAPPGTGTGSNVMMPVCDVRRARCPLPFLVEVDYDRACFRVGEGGTRRYFCLFGWRFSVGRELRRVT